MFSNRESANNAIMALNGKFEMTGCKAPMIVQYSDTRTWHACPSCAAPVVVLVPVALIVVAVGNRRAVCLMYEWTCDCIDVVQPNSVRSVG